MAHTPERGNHPELDTGLLYPCGIATVTPQTFTVASRPVNTWRSRSSPPPDKRQVRTAPSPYPPDWSWWSVKGRQTLISLVHLPVSLTGPASSGSTDASQRCQGCSHPPRHLPDQAAPSFTQPLRRPGGEGLSPPLDFGRLVAHMRFRPVVTYEDQSRVSFRSGISKETSAA
jgi:hypothetical protein